MDFEELSDFQGIRRSGGGASLSGYKEELLFLT